jgi:RHS repeat-associated protein
MYQVEPSTGQVLLDEEDFLLNGELSFVWTRRYQNLSEVSGALGPGWSHRFDRQLVESPEGLVLVDEQAGRIPLLRPEPGQAVPIPAAGLVIERGGRSFALHERGAARSTYSPDPSAAGHWPLVRFDQSGSSSVWLRYQEGHLAQLRTTHGHKIQLATNAAGRIETISLGEGAAARPLVRYVYDPEGRLVQARDAEGRTTVYEYSGGLLVRRTNRLRGSLYLEYDDRRRCLAVWQDGRTRLRRYQYDDRRRTVLVTDAFGRRALWRFLEPTVLDEEVRFDGSIVRRIYLHSRRPLSVIGDGIPPTVVKRDALQNVVQTIGPGGETRGWTYDDLGRMVEVVDPTGAVTRLEYDQGNHVVRWVDGAGAEWSFQFDSQGRLAAMMTPLGNTVRAARTIDGTIRLEDSLGWLHSAQHDAAGNVIRIDLPSGAGTQLQYDGSRRIVALTIGKKATAKRRYDVEGHLVERVDFAGNMTRYQRDPFGLLLEWTEPTGRSIRYEYDDERRLVAARASSGSETRFRYDDCGRLVERTFGDGRVETIQYDDQGGRCSIVESGGMTTHSRYLPGGLLAEIRSGEHRAGFEYDLAGRCTGALAGGHRVDRKYGATGCLQSELQDGFAIEYESNPLGLATVRRDPTGRITRYLYNVRGRLIEIDDSLCGIHRFERDQYGRKAVHVLPNGIRRRFFYDEDDAVVRVVTHHPDGSVLRERTYAYGPTGEIARAETLGDGVETFDYDAGFHLLSRRSTRGDHESFGYDVDGNLTAIGGRPAGYEQGRLRTVGPLRYDYDPAGRVLARSQDGAALSFSYGLGGLIEQVTLPEGVCCGYDYDGLGRRVAKHGPGLDVRYHWDQDVPLMETRTSATGEDVCAYLFFPGSFQPLGHHRNGQTFHYDLDQRGLIGEVYDDAATEVARYHYRSFGTRQTVRCDRGEADPPWRMLGQYADPETGLYYNRMRYYDPEVGRFLAPDLDPLQVHHGRYTYGPNPIGWSDPLGLMPRFSRAKDHAWAEVIPRPGCESYEPEAPASAWPRSARECVAGPRECMAVPAGMHTLALRACMSFLRPEVIWARSDRLARDES